MTPVLLIGYGNTLRRDDGAGPAVVARFAGRAGLRVLVVHQLVPELADELAGCRRVVFVDAAVGVDCVQVRPLAPTTRAGGLGHTGDPARLLALTAALHDRVPAACLVTIPAHDLGYGEGFSAAAAVAMDEATAAVEGLVASGS